MGVVVVIYLTQGRVQLKGKFAIIAISLIISSACVENSKRKKMFMVCQKEVVMLQVFLHNMIPQLRMNTATV